jgi:hypothetical protein
MVANSGGGFANQLWPAWVVSTIHAAVGLFMSLVIMARTLSLIPPPDTDDPAERRPER